MIAIDADELFKDIRENFEKYACSDVLEDKFFAMRYQQIEQYLKTFPVVEVEPVKRGHWIDIRIISVGCGDNAYLSNCSACGAEVVLCDYDNYCPACGADMTGE